MFDMGGVNSSVANILLNRINSTKLAITRENIQIMPEKIPQLGVKFP